MRSLTTSLLWQTLETFSNLENKHLGLWLASPYRCRKSEPLLLFQYFCKCISKKQEPTVENAILAVWGNNPKPEPELRLLMSELLDHAEQSLVARKRAADRGRYELELAAIYRERGLEKHFNLQWRDAGAAWEKQPFRHVAYFEALAGLEFERYRYLSAGKPSETINLQALSDYTDAAYILKKLQETCLGLTHQTVYKAEYDFGLLEAALQHYRSSAKLQIIPALQLYYHCYLLLTQPEDDAPFDTFKSLLLTHAGLLPEEEQRNLHLLAINFCIRKINQSQQRFFREALDLYQSALKAGLLLEKGRLSHLAYNNIVAIALKVGEADWAETFIRDYVTLLDIKHARGTFHLNMARVHYLRKQPLKVLENLQAVDFKDMANSLIAKTLQLKIYYETGDFDNLEKHLQNMQTYLKRQRILGYHKQNYQLIIRYGRRLMQHNPNSRSERTALRERISAEPVLTEKDWFLEMLS